MKYIFGRWGQGPLESAEEAASLCREAASRRERAAACPPERLLAVLEAVRRRWTGGLCAGVQEILARESGWSEPMCRRAADQAAWALSPERLRESLGRQLGGIARFTSSGEGLYWHPLGSILHVLPGNSPVPAILSMVDSLATGNATILKPSGASGVLEVLLRALEAADEAGDVVGSLAVAQYPPRREMVEEFQRGVDGIVVWGGEEAVRAYRQGPSRARLVERGPRLSVAVALRGGLQAMGAGEAARRLAREVVLWDQAVCGSPQACFVQGEPQARSLLEALAGAFESAAVALPPGRVDVDTAVEVQKLRAVAEVAQARGEGLLIRSARGIDWTVVLERGPLAPSPLHRTLRLIPFEDWEDVEAKVEPWRGHIHTVGLLASAPERAQALSRLAAWGATKVAGFGEMLRRSAGDPRDGEFELPRLMRLFQAAV